MPPEGHAPRHERNDYLPPNWVAFAPPTFLSVIPEPSPGSLSFPIVESDIRPAS